MKEKIRELIKNSEYGMRYNFKGKDNKQIYIDSITELIREGEPIEFSSNYLESFEFRKLPKEHFYICPICEKETHLACCQKVLFKITANNEYIYPRKFE